jgi:hypothetical protein
MVSDDLHGSARDLRQKLYRLEVLLSIEKGRLGGDEPAGEASRDAERAAALSRLIESGLIEAAPAPEHFRLKPEGRDFLKAVRSKVAFHGMVDWTRVDEIDFSKL